MGAIGGLLGTAGGVSGTGQAAPKAAPLQQPTTPAQVNAANTGVTQSLAGSDALLKALGGQNGVGNQQSVLDQGQNLSTQLGGLGSTGTMGAATTAQGALNRGLTGLDGTGTMGAATTAQGALNRGLTGLDGTGTMGAATTAQGALNSQLGNAQGVGIQTGAVSGLQNVLGRQQMTADQLQGVANGTGPNPAQAALNQATGQNIANQAALMAGQRGAGANVGLMARQAAQQGAATQQQAVGQGATMQAQQQLGALGQLTGQEQAMGATNQGIAGIGAGLTGQQQAGIGQQFGQGATTVGQQQAGIGQQFGQGATTVGQQQTGIGQQFGQGTAGVGLQQGQLGMNAGIAQNQVGNLIGATGTNIQGNLGNAGQQLGALGNFNTNLVNQQGNINNANTSLATTQMHGQQDLLGGLLQGAGLGASAAGARGGLVHLADGGPVPPYAAPAGQGPVMAAPGPAPVTAPPPGPQSSFGQFLSGGMDSGAFLAGTPPPAASTPDTTANAKIPGQDPGESRLHNGASALAQKGLMAALAAARGGMTHDYRGGGPVKAQAPSEKAVKPGNSYANDKIKAVLSDKEIVLPRSVTQSADPAKSAADFVRKVMAKRGRQ